MKYCSNCGEQNSDDARFCTKCGFEMSTPSSTPYVNTTSSENIFQNSKQMPTTYLWQSILVTILCCLPLGIPAIVYASKVDNLFLRGDIVGAERASRTARSFCIWGLLTALILLLLYVIIVAIWGSVTWTVGF